MGTLYADILRKLDSLRARTARFRRVVLHVHSPASFDWGRGGDKVRNDRSRFQGEKGAEEFLAELREHVDLAAVTDHMKCGLACSLTELAGKGDEFVVLPGMEVNLVPEAALGCARVHLVVILPEGATGASFERLFAGLEEVPADDGKRTGREEITGISLTEWVGRVHGEGGICIAAHVDSNQGVRRLFRHSARETLRLFSGSVDVGSEKEAEVGESLKAYLLESGLDAVEVAREANVPHYRWASKVDGRERWIPTIMVSDAHCLEDVGRKDRVTCLKMTRLGIGGLKDALAFPETRIRFPASLPEPPSPRLLGVQMTGGDTSFFAGITVAFAENLNCLIGIRGSGKSTLVEALRYTFGYNRSLGELGDFRKTIEELQRANLADCMIRVVYRISAGDVRVLEATFDPKSDYTTKVFTAEGDFLDTADVERCGDYPLRLFGWSEIELLGRDPARQRDLLDRLIPDICDALDRKAELQGSLRDNRAVIEKAIRDLEAAYETSNREIRRFTEYKADFDRLNTEQVKGLFSVLDLTQAKKRVLQKLKGNAEELVEALGLPDALTLRSGLDELLVAEGEAVREWWSAQEMKRLDIISAEEDVKGYVRKAIERLRVFIEIVDQRVKEVDAEIGDVQQELRKQFAGDTSLQRIADLRANAEKRLRHVNGLRDGYQAQWEGLVGLLRKRTRITEQLAYVQDEISGIRARSNTRIEAALNRFMPEAMNVTIDFKAGGDKRAFLQSVQSLLSGATRYKARQLNLLVAELATPHSFGDMMLNGRLSQLVGKEVEIAGRKEALSKEDVEAIAGKHYPFERDEHADVRILSDRGERLRAVLDLQEVEWDDLEAILLNGQPVNEKSPGQRSSAMLPLVALAETTPLVIDQPEDNLDKRLIGSVLARVLAELKEKRQIIVCTHDPNILVGGDAEQVIVLEAESDRRGKVANHGSIDNGDIVDTVVNLLEGGAAAFEARRKRYAGRIGL